MLCNILLVIACFALFRVLFYLKKKRQQFIAARDRQNMAGKVVLGVMRRALFQHMLERIAKVRAFHHTLKAFTVSFTPDEMLRLQTFLKRHPSYESICKGRQVSFEEGFSMTITHFDFLSGRDPKTGRQKPSMRAVIFHALASFKKELFIFRARKKFVENDLY